MPDYLTVKRFPNIGLRFKLDKHRSVTDRKYAAHGYGTGINGHEWTVAFSSVGSISQWEDFLGESIPDSVIDNN